MSEAPHDEWFQHPAEEGAAQEAHGAINAPFIIGFLAVVIIITFSLIFIILGYVGREVADAQGEKSEDRTDIIAREYQEAQIRWRSQLEGDPRWIDADANKVRMPVDYAAQEVVSLYQQDDQQSGQRGGG